MHKTRSFRTICWGYFILFSAVLFALLWLLQTVFIQSFYNTMLKQNTRRAAAEIAGQSGSAGITEVIDRLSLDNSLLVFVTDTEGTLLYSSDSYKSYYTPSDTHEESANPWHRGETLSWQTGNYRNLPAGYADFLNALRSSADGNTEIESDTKYIYGTWITLQDGTKAVLYTSAALGVTGAAVSILRMQLVWVSLLSLGIAFVIAWFLAERFSVPVEQLSRQAEMLVSDRYEPLAQRGFCTELDGLADCMDETAGKLAQAKQYQQELLANVSHDLRTPLTMIKGYAEMVRDISWEDEQERTADLNIILRETDRLTALVNEILAYSRLRETDIPERFAETDLSALVRKVISQFEPLLRQDRVVIEQDIMDGCLVYGDAELLERAVYNLLDNAQRHIGEDRRVRIALTKEPDVLLEVQDFGEGIEESELAHIWEKYYTSRQRGKKGVSGLGLAIVKEITRIHGAECGADSRKGAGSRFWIRLKKAARP